VHCTVLGPCQPFVHAEGGLKKPFSKPRRHLIIGIREIDIAMEFGPCNSMEDLILARHGVLSLIVFSLRAR